MIPLEVLRGKKLLYDPMDTVQYKCIVALFVIQVILNAK